MAKYELRLPQMGESVAEATITAWLKKVGDTIEAEESIVEVATDKVDSEIPSEVSGVITEILFEVDQVVKIGQVMAIIETEQTQEAPSTEELSAEVEQQPTNQTFQSPTFDNPFEVAYKLSNPEPEQVSTETTTDYNFPPELDRFYSPLVKSIAKKEGISLLELNKILGTGADNRVTKDDILMYLESRRVLQETSSETTPTPLEKASEEAPISQIAEQVPFVPTQMKTYDSVPSITPMEEKRSESEKTDAKSLTATGDEIIEMTRMGKMISEHMTRSKQTSAHVQSFTEVDVTRIWNWRNKVKKAFETREGEKFTFTPIFMEAVTQALKDYPMMNISVEDTKIIKKKNINIGMATALPDGNLIVPVIKNADQLSLRGMAKVVNDLATRARAGQLKPDEVKDGTYTVTNIGSFGNVFGTPIINQPQVGILAIGAIRKVPAVIETPDGDLIGIRYKMMLSHSYDHRVVNGALGGMFVQRVAEYLEHWDITREV
ncbi:dihydrolipoamide acetyltransferase family protein [Capnocytophaga canimorsus]|uniref:dihydrolipoamide acetyltransferase family protein n=1 Tax=Capnocytophaga canimorsus TaxID=28188 RepID=UPI0037D54B02